MMESTRAISDLVWLWCWWLVVYEYGYERVRIWLWIITMMGKIKLSLANLRCVIYVWRWALRPALVLSRREQRTWTAHCLFFDSVSLRSCCATVDQGHLTHLACLLSNHPTIFIFISFSEVALTHIYIVHGVHLRSLLKVRSESTVFVLSFPFPTPLTTSSLPSNAQRS